MAKLILLILAALAVYLVIRNFRRRGERREADGAQRVEESMVRCATCGVHHPRSESLLSAGKFYCSSEHEQRSRDGG